MEQFEASNADSGEVASWPTSPLYKAKHIDCPECGEPMSLFTRMWMCWCGYEEPCCE